MSAVRHRDHPVADVASIVDADTQCVDVREPDEVAGGTIDGFVNIPLGALGDRVGELAPDRRVVLLCRSGNRSTTAAKYLTANGFTDVVNLAGGMLAYDQGGLS
ncbi:MAG: rhodanese-like domain-containing protein [Acidimicrobiales bacterium]